MYQNGRFYLSSAFIQHQSEYRLRNGAISALLSYGVSWDTAERSRAPWASVYGTIEVAQVVAAVTSTDRRSSRCIATGANRESDKVILMKEGV